MVSPPLTLVTVVIALPALSGLALAGYVALAFVLGIVVGFALTVGSVRLLEA